MTTTRKHSGKASSIPKGLAMAGLISMVTTISSAATIAGFLEKEKITWVHAGYWIMGMLFLASFAGSKLAYAFIKRQKFLISIMSGMVYWGLLLCITAMFFRGDFSSIWETAGIIAAGSGTAALVSVPSAKKKGGYVVKLNKKIR